MCYYINMSTYDANKSEFPAGSMGTSQDVPPKYSIGKSTVLTRERQRDMRER